MPRIVIMRYIFIPILVPPPVWFQTLLRFRCKKTKVSQVRLELATLGLQVVRATIVPPRSSERRTCEVRILLRNSCERAGKTEKRRHMYKERVLTIVAISKIRDPRSLSLWFKTGGFPPLTPSSVSHLLRETRPRNIDQPPEVRVCHLLRLRFWNRHQFVPVIHTSPFVVFLTTAQKCFHKLWLTCAFERYLEKVWALRNSVKVSNCWENFLDLSQDSQLSRAPLWGLRMVSRQ